jgi:hypothetical protein
MVSCIERAIEIPPESPHFSSAFDHLAPEALLLSASLQRIGIRVLLGFYAITRNSTVDTSTIKNSIALQVQPCATLLNGYYLRKG